MPKTGVFSLAESARASCITMAILIIGTYTQNLPLTDPAFWNNSGIADP